MYIPEERPKCKKRSFMNDVYNKQKKQVLAYQIADNRPVAIAQKKVKDAIHANATNMPDIRNSRIAQMKFYFEEGNDIPGTALKRVWEHPLTKEIEGSTKSAEVKYVNSNYSANSGFVMGETTSLVMGAKLKLPQKEEEQTKDLEALKKKNEVTTLHELVHARAIFADEFNVEPMVFHTVYKNMEFEGRELIPLEEALTVGFKDSEEFKHTLHRADTFEDLSLLNSKQWETFAPKQWSRYKRIYGDQKIETSEFTDNSIRMEKEVSLREFYAEEARGNDEAWNGIVGKDPLAQKVKFKEIDENLEMWKGKFDSLTKMSFTDVKKLFEDNNIAADELSLFSPDKIDVPTEDAWQQERDAFSEQLKKMETAKTSVYEKGELDSWAKYQKEYEILKALNFSQYIKLLDS